MKRLVKILGALLTATVLSAGIAAAASLAFSTGLISAGHVAVAGCTSSSLTTTRNVDNTGNVTQVNVLAVPQACAGQTLAVTLENSLNASLASTSTTVGACTGGCTVTFTGFSGIPATSLTAYALSLSN
jgi:hypothetical protein